MKKRVLCTASLFLGTGLIAGAVERPEWNTPEVLQLNREAPFNMYLLMENLGIPVASYRCPALWKKCCPIGLYSLRLMRKLSPLGYFKIHGNQEGCNKEKE